MVTAWKILQACDRHPEPKVLRQHLLKLGIPLRILRQRQECVLGMLSHDGEAFVDPVSRNPIAPGIAHGSKENGLGLAAGNLQPLLVEVGLERRALGTRIRHLGKPCSRQLAGVAVPAAVFAADDRVPCVFRPLDSALVQAHGVCPFQMP